ncbi:hypothetical protein [Falsiroseomonas sp.]|uniref:hypothetical protein n=1 Tax=Falsiroseomonas sp. TaxID=2870721 RepID=UPI0027349E47|nr:hypothetical protein [Falsiroseomonas sp.]
MLLLLSPAAAQPSSRPERHPDHWRLVLRGITLHLPYPYVATIFGNDGFTIQAFAADARPYNRQTDSYYPGGRVREAVVVTVGEQRRFTGTDLIRRRITIRARDIGHEPAEEADLLDGPDGPPVPEGLIYYRALPVPPGPHARREDMFVPREPRRALDGSPLPEAIFCLSANAPFVLQRPLRERVRLSCRWMLVWRDIEVSMFLDRRHLADWAGLRRRILVLLDDFVVGGPAEAGPPLDPFPSSR